MKNKMIELLEEQVMELQKYGNKSKNIDKHATV